jgi:hypothetical protein
VSRRLRTTTLVIVGFERALWRAPPPPLPVAPVMMSFILKCCSMFVVSWFGINYGLMILCGKDTDGEIQCGLL